MLNFIIFYILCLLFSSCISNQYIYEYPDLEFNLETNQANIKLEAFKASSNEKIIEDGLEYKYNKLNWVSIGRPTMLYNNLTKSYFNFNNEGFDIKIELINDFICNKFIQEIKNKYSIDVSKNQIKNIDLDILECKLKYIDQENKFNYLFGNAKDLKSNPVKVEFYLTTDLKQRKSIETKLRNNLKVSIECDFRTGSFLKQEKILTINEPELVNKIFTNLDQTLCLSEYQLKNLYSILYSNLNILDNFNLDFDSFWFKIHTQFIRKSSDSFNIKQIPFSRYLKSNCLSDMENDFKSLFIFDTNNNIILNKETYQNLKLKLEDKNELLNFNFEIDKLELKSLIELNNLSDIKWLKDSKTNKIYPISIKCVCLDRNKLKNEIQIDSIKSFNKLHESYSYSRKYFFEINQLNNIVNPTKMKSKNDKKFLKIIISLVSKIKDLEKLISNNSNLIENLNAKLTNLVIENDENPKSSNKSETSKAYIDLSLVTSLEDRPNIGDTYSFAVLQNGYLVSGSSDRKIRIWNTNNWSLINTIEKNDFWVFSLTVLQNGNLASSSEKKIKIWNTNDSTVSATLNNHTGSIFSLIVLQNGYLASGSSDYTIKIWNPNDGSLFKTLFGHTQAVNALTVLQNGFLVSGSSDNSIKIWNTNDWSLVKTLNCHSASVIALTVLNNGNLASGSKDNSIKILNTNDWSLIKTLNYHSSSVNALTVLNNGYLVSGSKDTTIKIWNPNDWSLFKTLKNHTASVNALIVLKNGYLASGSDDKTIKIWKPLI